MIRSMKDQGLSISEISRRLGISRTTVRIYEELRKKGFKGSYSLVKQYSRPLRNDRKILAVILQYCVSAIISHLPDLLQYPDS